MIGKDPEEIRKYHRQWRKNNPDKQRQYKKTWYLKDPEKRRADVRKWRKANKDKVTEQSRNYRSRYPIRTWAQCSITNHRKKGFVVLFNSLELEANIQDKKSCPYCEIILDFTPHKKKSKHNSPTIDRINNTKILSLKNIEIICRRCNTAKQNFIKEEFIEYCRRISNKFKTFNKGDKNANKESFEHTKTAEIGKDTIRDKDKDRQALQMQARYSG